ncbi:7TM diverse intracellular signaling domain-containing protein [Olleya sp. Ti.3.14]|uniref:hybrid sensor histidine kinase/response regulator n=1 Tax=Olleya sp. Ti.3.14 TaxID=3121297 RepID=UPI0031200BAB
MKHLYLLICFINFSVFAQNTTYNPITSSGDLYEYSQYASVGNKDLSIQDILLEKNLEYQDLSSDNQSLGFTSQNYWVKFKLENTSNDKATYYLETARPVTDKANMFIVTQDSIQTFKSGDQIPFETRQVAHRSTVFKLVLLPNTVQDVYMEFGSDGETINLPLNLFTESEFWIMNYKQQLFLGLFYGLLFLAGIIYLFFYTSLKEKTFLYYGCYVFSIALLQGALDGFIFEFLLTNGGYLNSKAVLIAALFSNFFLLKYCEYFLKVSQYLGSFKIVYNIIYVVLGVLFVMVFISPKTMEFVYPLSNLNGLLSLILLLATIFTMRYKKLRVDFYFSIGIFFLIIGLLGFVMNNLSLLPNNFFTLNSSKFGTGMEVIFLSLSMTNLLKKLREDKEESQELALNRSQEISQLKTFFMSNMSHELRTPINAIMGIAQTELKNNGNSESNKNYEIIKNASLSLLSNVNDILDFEKIEKNELKLVNEVFNPFNAVTEISNNWKLEAQRKGLNYHFEIDADIPDFIESDLERFVQIINNVLSNAVKFTAEGSIGFKLKCFPQPNDVNRFSLQVSDSGVGMTPETKKNIFDSFNQMRNNHKRKFGGIGLGLTIVNRLVDLFDGEITVESQLNKGTVVYIDLPLKVVKIATLSDQKANPSTRHAAPLNVLVVEDNMLNQMVIKKLLSTDNKFTMVIANNGEEALKLLTNASFDLILMDLQMPIMDGYEATQHIRSGICGPKIQSIPIIAVTADVMQETKQRVLNIGMNDYMTKPINKELLFKKIERCIYDTTNLKIA